MTRAAEPLAQVKGLDASTARRLISGIFDGHLLAGVDHDGEDVLPYRKDDWARNF